MKKLLLFMLLILLGSTTSNAYDVKIDGIYYNLSGSEAIVTNNGANSYRGDITIPEHITSNGLIYTVTKLHELAFENESALLSINLPETLKEIGNCAFGGCSNLLSITIPGNVTSMGNGIFRGCSSLNRVTFSDGEEDLHIDQAEWSEHMFKDCSVSEIYIGRNIQDYTGYREFVTNPRNVHYGLFWSKALESLTISENVTKICYLAFAGCTNLNHLTISHSVSFLDEGAFADCISLTSLELDNPQCIIGNCAFWECSSITDVTLNVMEICNSAFDGCRSIKNVSLGKNVLSIGDHAFMECKEMENLYCYAATPPHTGSSIFQYTIRSGYQINWGKYNQNVSLYVPKASINAYRGIEPWKSFMRITAIPVPVEGISLTERTVLYVGDKEKLQPKVLPTDATNQEVAWSSSNPAIVEVAEDGTIHANASGTAVITATTEDGGFEASCTVYVYDHTTGVEMINQVSIPIDNTYKLNAQTQPLETSDGKITYSSSNNAIASINNDGVVTAIKKGSCTITATSVDGGHTATCLVRVTQPVEALTLEKHSLTLYVGETDYLYAQIIPATADDKSVVWSTSNEQVATVDASGNVSAIKGGEAWIKVISNDNTEAKDSCKVTVSYSTYTLTYIVDGEIYQKFPVIYGSNLTPLEEPIKEGYTFSGWSEIPETMPAHNVTVTGTFTINSYALTYIIDGEEYKNLTIVYGSEITPEEEPTKEGYTFSGWSEIPEIMPAHNVTVNGTFTVNNYTLSYIIDNEEYKNITVVYGSEITPEPTPTKEGYTFSGWSEIPATMPAHDVIVSGTFTINQYTIVFNTDGGSSIGSITQDYNSSIIPPTDPTKEGYTFTGWVPAIPETMPVNGLTVKAQWQINSYPIIYIVDGEEYSRNMIQYGDEITPIEEPIREGYTFSGWSEIPETMPAEEVRVFGTFTMDINPTLDIEISNAGYATFFDSKYSYIIPEGLSAQVVTNVSNNKLIYKTIADGSASDIVPKGTAVMLASAGKQSGTFTLTLTENSSTYSGTNLLHGSDEETMTTGDGLHYKLSYGKTGTAWDNVFGWYWGAQNGAPFLIEGHKAWLVIPHAPKTRAYSGYTIEGDATDITDILFDGEEHAIYYDMQGRRIGTPTNRGIYIKNGKKVVIK